MQVIDGLVWNGSYLELIAIGAIMALAFRIISPLVRLVFLPLNMLTLGIAGIFVNAFIFWAALQFSRLSLTIQPWQFQGVEVGYIPTLVLAASLVTLLVNVADTIV
jgi:uncharacterized membrane protein YvlD (DUF360 family)